MSVPLAAAHCRKLTVAKLRCFSPFLARASHECFVSCLFFYPSLFISIVWSVWRRSEELNDLPSNVDPSCIAIRPHTECAGSLSSSPELMLLQTTKYSLVSSSTRSEMILRVLRMCMANFPTFLPVTSRELMRARACV